MTTEWLFEPMDSLFFRGGLSFSKGETGWLESIFPPHPETMQGVVRSAVILSQCSFPAEFTKNNCGSCSESAKNPKCPLPCAIGSSIAGDYGTLDLYGPYLVKGKQRYYPAPLALMKSADGKHYFSLEPSKKAVLCDLGNIRLPARPDSDKNKDTLEPFEGWIREDAMIDYLRAEKISGDGERLLESDSFYDKEPRVGIGRDYSKHTVAEGMLYSIVPLRFREEVSIGLRVGGLKGISLTPPFVMKLGGEGKACRVEPSGIAEGKIPGLKNDDRYVKMVLLQPADFDGVWHPPGFSQAPVSNGADCRVGELQGVKLRLLSACVGRPQRVGGWDMSKKIKKPKISALKPMKSYVPAGSVYYFEVKAGQNASKLNTEGKIGKNTAIGLGHYIIGRWNNV
jgi:CRISPR-associated protein Cmr3